MKIVKESLNFEKNNDPKKSLDIGKDSYNARKYLFDKLESEGIIFYHPNDQKEEEIIERYLRDRIFYKKITKIKY